jgi:hypothetical protein
MVGGVIGGSPAGLGASVTRCGPASVLFEGCGVGWPGGISHRPVGGIFCGRHLAERKLAHHASSGGHVIDWDSRPEPHRPVAAGGGQQMPVR